jgi:hypothetical protein
MYNKQELLMHLHLTSGQIVSYHVQSCDAGRTLLEDWKREGGFWLNVENPNHPTFFNFSSVVKATFED